MNRSRYSGRWTMGILVCSSIVLASPRLSADEIHVVSAAELLRGPTLKVGRGGASRISLWTAEDQRWSARIEGDQILLRRESPGGADRPAWQTLRVPGLQPGKTYRASVEWPDAEGGKDGEAGSPRLLVLAPESTDLDTLLDLTQGRLDTGSASEDARLSAVRSNQEGVDFRAPATLEDWQRRASALREQMMVTLGQWPELGRGAVTSEVVGTIEHEDYVIERIRLRTLSGLDLSGNLYRPRVVEGRLPAVLSPHGHWAEGRLNADVQQRCIGLAKLGCLVFMYDMVGYNESKPFGHSFLSPRLKRWGFSLAALQTWNSRRVLDWMLARPDVDATRVACTGESGGGTQTFLLTAIDSRVKVSAPVVMVSEGFQGGCECENCPGLRWGTDNVEFAALCAPRPLKLVGATGDWTANTTSHILPVLRDIYGLYGLPDRVSADVFTAPHNYNQSSRNAVYAFLGHWLLGIDDPLKTMEGPQSTESEEVLLTLDAEHPLPDDLSSPAVLEDFLVAQRAEEIERMRPSSFAAEWDAHRRYLRRIHEVRVGLEHPAASEVRYEEIRRADRDGLMIGHGILRRRGDSVPVVWVEEPGLSKRSVILTHERGKRVLIGEDGRLAPLAKGLVEAGSRVIAFDPLLAGESVGPAHPILSRPETVHSETYNRSLAVDRMRDLETVVTWAAARSGILSVDLVAGGRMGPLALLALPGLDGLGRSYIDLEGFDYGDGSSEITVELDLAGVLQFGGLPVALALAAPRPVAIARPASGFERIWADNAYGMAGASNRVRYFADALNADEVLRWITDGT